MADKEKKEEQTPVPQGSDQGEKSGSILHAIVVVLLALLVVVVVTAGVFYFAVKNNINGFAYVMKPRIENHPVLRLALPGELLPQDPNDPDDPENLTEKQLLKKYEEYRVKVRELEEAITKSNETIEQLKNDVSASTDSKAILEENQNILETIKLNQAKLDADKKALSVLIAKGDVQGFREYFEKVDKATAEGIYEEIVNAEVLSQNKLELAKPFSVMEPASAASVLTELFKKDQSSALDIFEGLKPNASALIFEQMDSKIAADITKLLSDRKNDR